MLFRDRTEAGRLLGGRLDHLRGTGVVVLGLPRGGVPVAAEIARALDAELDVIVVRKLGVPYQPELAMGAIGEDGVVVVNDDVLAASGVSPDQFRSVETTARAELESRLRRLRGRRPRTDLTAKTAVIVDDGIATGSTARAACQVARAHGAARVVVAVPVAPPEALRHMAQVADEVVCLQAPSSMMAIGQWYQDFSPTPEDDVAALLDDAAVRAGAAATAGAPPPDAFDGDVVVGADELPGRLRVPRSARGVVVFAHGSGSSRHSPRNRAVADALHDRGLATLLFDLLTTEEEADRANVFDVDLLGRRLVVATLWIRDQPPVRGLPVGYFGASTGAAAALWAAAEPTVAVGCVVSRGGRPDLAGNRLATVDAPTLLIVGELDRVVIDLNADAARRLPCEHRLVVVPGATHLFAEPGTLEEVARLAGDWFLAHLTPALAVVRSP